MANAGTVTINLDAESVKLIRELKKASRQTQTTANRMQKSMSGAFKQIRRVAGTLGIALAGVFSVQMIRRQLAYAGNLQRVAETVAFTAEQVQELRFAAGQLNLEERTLDMALQRFSRRMGEAAINTGEALNTVKQYGIEIKNTDGTIRDNIDILADWAEIIANVDDEQERLRIAFKLFDSEGAPLVRLLSQGAAGMEAFGDQARKLGVVISDDLIDDAAETDRVFNQIKATIDSKMAAQVAANAGSLASLGEAIGAVAGAAVDGIAGVTAFFAEIRKGLDGLNALADRVLGEEQGDRISAAFDEYKAAADVLRGLESAGDGNANIGNSLDSNIAAQKQKVDELRAHWTSLRELAVDTHKTFIDANLAAAEAAKAGVQDTVAAVQEAEGMLAELSIEGKLDRILRPELSEDIEQMNRSTEDWFASLIESSKAVGDLSKQGEEMGFIFESAFEDAILEGQKLGDVLKGLLKDLARMLIRSTITAPLGDAIGGFFGGAKALGGPVAGGASYLVGEEGPELFTPGASGFITPNNALGGGAGVSISYTIDARGVDEASVLNRMIPLLQQTVELTKSEIRQDRAEGRA